MFNLMFDFERLASFAFHGGGVTILKCQGKVIGSFRSATNSWIRYEIPKDKLEDFYLRARQLYFMKDVEGFPLEDWLVTNGKKLDN